MYSPRKIATMKRQLLPPGGIKRHLLKLVPL